MRKLKSNNTSNALIKNINLIYINIFILIILASILFSGCVYTAPLMNSPTPVPSYTPIPIHTPTADALNTANAQLYTSNNATPIYDETYPVPDIIGNSGANIENGGLSTSDQNNIYYIDDGIWSMSKVNENKIQITDMQNISCLNNVGEYIYFLSAHDGTIYRVQKQEHSVPEALNIAGASSLVVIGEYMYYCSTIGENSTQYVYKSPLQGIIQECLFIKASSITPDGAYFYFNNLEDESTLWRYDTISSQIVKISSDTASQINVIDDKIYYISQDTDYNVVCIDRNGLNQIVVVTQGCKDLNIIQNYLIYRTIDTGYIQSYNIKTGETVTLVSYGELFALSATDNKVFFQSCPADGFEPETYIFDISTTTLNKSLPKKIYAFIKDIDLETLTFDYETVMFYEGEDAIEQYSAYNSTTAEQAKEAIATDEGTYFIYNKNVAWIRCASHDWTNITLIRRTTALSDNNPYTANLSVLQSLFDNNPSLEGNLLFELTIIDKKAVEINEVYYTIINNN